MCADLRVTDLVAALKESESMRPECRDGHHRLCDGHRSLSPMFGRPVLPCACPCHQEAQK